MCPSPKIGYFWDAVSDRVEGDSLRGESKALPLFGERSGGRRQPLGFVSKYKKGQSIPDGETEFQFQAAGFNFHSTLYEWLVIAGAKAQYKGSGTINGTGDFGFMLTGIDGQINGGGGNDKFRVKVWNKATSAIIYDNQMGALDGDPPTTLLGGGSIVLHDK